MTTHFGASQSSCLLWAVPMASAHECALFLNLLPENRKQQPGSRREKTTAETHTFASRSRRTFGLTVACSNQVLLWEILTDMENNNVFHLQ